MGGRKGGRKRGREGGKVEDEKERKEKRKEKMKERGREEERWFGGNACAYHCDHPEEIIYFPTIPIILAPS